MKAAISYALSWPERLKTGLSRLNLAQCMDLNFLPPDFKRFPALKLAYQACKQGGTLPAVLNAANEIAVAAFLNKKIRFPEISLVVAETLNRIPRQDIKDVGTVLDADMAARMQAESITDALQLKFQQLTGQKTNCPDLPPGLQNND